MTPEESVLDKFSFWIEIIDDSVGIGFMACSEHHEFELFPQFLKYFLSMWSDVDWSQHGVTPRKGNWYLDLVLL